MEIRIWRTGMGWVFYVPNPRKGTYHFIDESGPVPLIYQQQMFDEDILCYEVEIESAPRKIVELIFTQLSLWVEYAIDQDTRDYVKLLSKC